MVYSCGKDKPAKSRYGIMVLPDLVTDSGTPIQMKYRISGPDIKTIDNLGPQGTINYFDLNQGTTTTVTTSIYQGPSRSLEVTIFKLLPDSTWKVAFKKLSFEGTVAGTFKVE
jgi:hypothetical protein